MISERDRDSCRATAAGQVEWTSVTHRGRRTTELHDCHRALMPMEASVRLYRNRHADCPVGRREPSRLLARGGLVGGVRRGGRTTRAVPEGRD
jgi:hypothetical protein